MHRIQLLHSWRLRQLVSGCAHVQQAANTGSRACCLRGRQRASFSPARPMGVRGTSAAPTHIPRPRGPSSRPNQPPNRLQFFLDTKLNILMVALPFAVISKAAGWGDAATFIFSMLALCPLAEVRAWACRMGLQHACAGGGSCLMVVVVPGAGSWGIHETGRGPGAGGDG